MKGNEVGVKLKMLRVQKGATLREVSEATGLSPFRVSKLEGGIYNINIKDLMLLKKYYDTTYDYILEYKLPEMAKLGKVDDAVDLANILTTKYNL